MPGSIAKAYAAMRGLKFTDKVRVRDEQVAMLQSVITELSKSGLNVSDKTAILSHVVIELEKQLDPAKPHNQNSSLFQLVTNIKKQLPPADDAQKRKNKELFDCYVTTTGPLANLLKDPGCRKLTSALMVDDELLARATAISGSKSDRWKQRTLAYAASQQGNLDIFFREEKFTEAYKQKGKKFWISSTRKEQIKFLKTLAATTIKENEELNETQAKILQGGIIFIREQLRSNDQGRLANLLTQMEQVIASNGFHLDATECKQALVNQVQKHPSDFNSSSKSFSKIIKELIDPQEIPPTGRPKSF
jgi:hypothetical protein